MTYEEKMGAQFEVKFHKPVHFGKVNIKNDVVMNPHSRITMEPRFSFLGSESTLSLSALLSHEVVQFKIRTKVEFMLLKFKNFDCHPIGVITIFEIPYTIWSVKKSSPNFPSSC